MLVTHDPEQNWCIAAVQDYGVIILFHRPVSAREPDGGTARAEQLEAARL
jgi:hypothetical protein